MKRLLAISYFFPPWLSPQSIVLQKILSALSSQGYEITVVKRNLSNANVPLDNTLSKLIPPEIKTISIDHNSPLHEKGKIFFQKLSRLPDTYNIWAVAAYAKIRKMLKDFDLLMTFSTPISDHLPGIFSKVQKPSLPWIACFSDPFLENPYTPFTQRQYYINTHIEKLIISKADGVTFINSFTRDAVMTKYPKKWLNKTYIIPHAFNEKLFPEVQQAGKKLMIRHIGDFYGKRTPVSFLKALQVLSQKIPDLHTKLSVEFYGLPHDDLKYWLAQYGVGQIVNYKGQVNYLESLALMKSADVLLVVDAPASKSLFLTSKVVEYLGARRPILAITPTEGATAEFIKNIRSCSYKHDNTQGIVSQLVKYLQQKAQEELCLNVPEHYYDRYRIETIVNKYLEVIHAVTS